MAAADVEEPPSAVPEPHSVSTTGDMDGQATAQSGPNSITTANTTGATDDAQNQSAQDNDPAPVSSATSASASATASPSPASPPRIVSDIEPARSLPQPAPVAAPPTFASASASASASLASPAFSVSPSINGLGARAGLTFKSRSNTPHHSPALPSPPVPLRPSPATSRPPQAVSQPPPPPAPNASHYQNSPVWRDRTPQPHGKLPIASAPASASVPPPPPASAAGSPAPAPTLGFPSPGREHVHTDPKFLDDKTRITYGIQQAIPAAVRRSVRDNWEKCLLGSEFHQAFVLNASIHHATHNAVQRGIRDFGRAMVSSAKVEIVDVMTPADIDAVASRLLSKASDSFLDAALELRLKSIDAKRLINALARAERLGYEPSDVVGDEDDPAATQPPVNHQLAMRSPAPQQPIAQPVSRPQSAQPASQPGAVLYCKVCSRSFVHRSAYDHHVNDRICTRSPAAPGGYKFSCQHCGQGFTTIMGVQYHNAKKVCGDFNDSLNVAPAPAALTPARPKGMQPVPMTPSSAPTSRAAPVLTPAPTPASAQAVISPSSLGGGPRKGTPGLRTPAGAVADPYAHLSPEQLAAMQEELRLAELNYGERFRQTSEISDPAEKKTRLDGLANSFGTKQSLIRKKYGVRLRMRRTKAEIQAERDRMQYKTAAELAADIGIPNPNPGRPPHSVVSTPSRPPVLVARASNGGAGAQWSTVNRPGAHTGGASAPPAPMSAPSSASPLSRSAVGGLGITDASVHAGNKRRFSGHDPSSESKRVAYSEMGGLSGGAAAPTTNMDPTLPAVAGVRAASSFSAKGRGTAEEPMALDDTDSESEDSGGDDEDIPAELPPSVRQSLQQASPSATPGPQSSSMPSSRHRPEESK